MLVRRLALVAALACLLAPVSPAAARPNAVFAAKITKEVISGHRAKFWFKAVHGTATGFYCTIAETGYVIGPPRACTSPRLFRKLAAGGWTFSVYAVNAAGTKSTTASYTFTIA